VFDRTRLNRASTAELCKALAGQPKSDPLSMDIRQELALRTLRNMHERQRQEQVIQQVRARTPGDRVTIAKARQYDVSGVSDSDLATMAVGEDDPAVRTAALIEIGKRAVQQGKFPRQQTAKPARSSLDRGEVDPNVAGAQLAAQVAKSAACSCPSWWAKMPNLHAGQSHHDTCRRSVSGR
jgi:Flp pilus assembly protein TadD